MTHRDGFPRLSARSAWRGDPGSYPADRLPDLYGSLSALLGISREISQPPLKNPCA